MLLIICKQSRPIAGQGKKALKRSFVSRHHGGGIVCQDRGKKVRVLHDQAARGARAKQEARRRGHQYKNGRIQPLYQSETLGHRARSELVLRAVSGKERYIHRQFVQEIRKRTGAATKLVSTVAPRAG